VPFTLQKALKDHNSVCKNAHDVFDFITIDIGGSHATGATEGTKGTKETEEIKPPYIWPPTSKETQGRLFQKKPQTPPKWCPNMEIAAKEIDKAVRAIGTARNRLDTLRGKLEPTLNICHGQGQMFQRRKAIMGKPDYCTQNNGDCSTCSLVNYGRDCHNNPVGSDQNLTGRLFGGGIDYLELDDWKQEVVRCPNELLIAQKEIKRLREYIYTEHPELRQDVVDLYKTDPLMKTIHMQICPCVFGLLSDKTNKQKLPICKGEQKAQREECIYQMKAANKDNGCKPEGDGSARCPSPFAVCTTSVGCRVGRKAS
jgi:hypothetical protein